MSKEYLIIDRLEKAPDSFELLRSDLILFGFEFLMFVALILYLLFKGIRILWWKSAYKSPFSKFLISVEKTTPKLFVIS